MIISEKQIMRLMELARRYYNVCGQMNWDDHQKETADLLRTITNQQSEELKVIE